MAVQKILKSSTKPTRILVDSKLRDVVADGAKWDRRKAESAALAADLLALDELTETEIRRFKRLADCSAMVEWGRSESGNWHPVRAFRCKSKVCATCRKLKSNADFCRLHTAIQKYAPKEQRFAFLTLTVPNCELGALRETIRKMSQAWDSRFTKWKAVKSAIDGAVVKLEVTRGADGSAHPHFHVLLALDPDYFSERYLNQSDWTELWTRAMQSERKLLVDIRAVPKCDSNSIGVLFELTKYVLKPLDASGDPSWTRELVAQTSGVRVIRPSGTFRTWLSELDRETIETEFQIPFGWQDDELIYRAISAPIHTPKLAEKHEKWTL